jgi:hypothetical protein
MQKIKIQPETIPEPTSKRLYRTLANSVRAAFEDPAVRKEYEAWKAGKVTAKT